MILVLINHRRHCDSQMICHKTKEEISAVQNKIHHFLEKSALLRDFK